MHNTPKKLLREIQALNKGDTRWTSGGHLVDTLWPYTITLGLDFCFKICYNSLTRRKIHLGGSVNDYINELIVLLSFYFCLLYSHI